MKRTWSAAAIAVLGALAGAGSWAEDLYSKASYDAIAADHHAVRPGDNLTIVVTELTTATADARTKADKDGSFGGSANLNSTTHQGSFDLKSSFDGGGTVERSGRLQARITVVVQSIEPDGYLRVKGQQKIYINHDKQTLVVEGRVRTQDIAADNTVPSTRLSDARISYTGDGVLAENERPGFFSRLLSWLRIL
jgi:flagellar L-ring protein FlgH